MPIRGRGTIGGCRTAGFTTKDAKATKKKSIHGQSTLNGPPQPLFGSRHHDQVHVIRIKQYAQISILRCRHQSAISST